MIIRAAGAKDKSDVLNLLDEFRADCITQITGKQGASVTARSQGQNIYEQLLQRDDYSIFLLENDQGEAVGIITGYLCPMLRSGEMRAEVEEFFLKEDFRGKNNARALMDKFFSWSERSGAVKVNLESDNSLERAHGFYTKYGFKTTAQRFIKKISEK